MTLNYASAREGALNFAHVARCMVAAKGDPRLARALADATAPEAVKLVMRTGVPSTAVADVWSAADAPYQVLEQAFLASLVNAGAADRIMADAVELPFRQRLGVGTGIAEATVVDEGKAVKVQAVPLNDLGDGMVPRKVVTLTVLTAELAKVSATAAIIERELRSGVALGTDRKFLADLVAATTPIASSENMLQDIMNLLDACTLNANSRPYFVFDMAALKRMVMARNASSVSFPDLTIAGGEINGVPTLVSDGLPSGAALLVDATQLAANRGNVGISVSQNAAVELVSAPTQDSTTSTGSTLVSMFQSDLVGVMAQRTFAYEIVRAGGVASLSGVSY